MHSEVARPEDVVFVNLCRRILGYCPGNSMLFYDLARFFSLVGIEFFAVVDALIFEIWRKYHSSRKNGASQTAAASFVTTSFDTPFL